MATNDVWLRGEASLEEMLEDPIVRLVMERDGLDRETVQSVCLAAAARKNMQFNSSWPPGKSVKS
jgi:hypothetical protein